MADYTKSPVFSSPSYWIALGVGVVGIGAAAMQERRGSAARYTVRDRNRPDMIFDPDIPKKITLHSEYFFRDALTESPFEVDTTDARMLNVVRDYLNARGFQFDPVEIESTHEDADEGAHFSIQDRASNLLIAIDEQRGPVEVYHGNHGKMKKIGEVYEGFSASKPTSAKALKSLKKIEGLLLKSRSGVVGIGAAAMQEGRKGSAAKGRAARAGHPRADHAGQKHVVTYSAPDSFETLSLCAKHDTKGKTYYTDSGRPFVHVSHGRHLGMCDKCEEESGDHGSAATTRMRGAGSMTRIPKVTQKRLDKDEALFERRFGGLVMDEDGNTITIEEDTDFDDSLAYYLDQHVLWTHVDGDGGTYLLPGLHRVNRIEYYISARPWTDADLNTVQIAWTK